MKDLSVIMQNVRAVDSLKKPAEKQAKSVVLKREAGKMADKVSSLKDSTERIMDDFKGMVDEKEKGRSQKPDDSAKDNK